MKLKTRLAAVFAGVALLAGSSSPSRRRPDRETLDILRAVSMNYDAAQAYAGGKRVGVYYDDDDDAGEAFSSPGGNSCAISWSQWGEGLSSGFSPEQAKAIGLKTDAAIEKDVAKISMWHELGHCTQKIGGKDNEYDADERALTRYLAGGGSRDTAQRWIYWRGLSGLMNMKRYSNISNMTPTVGIRLQAEFFGGAAPDIDKTRAAYDEIVRAAKPYEAQKLSTPMLIKTLLADGKRHLSPDAKALLTFYDAGCRYLAEVPTQKTGGAVRRTR